MAKKNLNPSSGIGKVMFLTPVPTERETLGHSKTGKNIVVKYFLEVYMKIQISQLLSKLSTSCKKEIVALDVLYIIMSTTVAYGGLPACRRESPMAPKGLILQY
jgi:hypothetical protein